MGDVDDDELHVGKARRDRLRSAVVAFRRAWDSFQESMGWDGEALYSEPWAEKNWNAERAALQRVFDDDVANRSDADDGTRGCHPEADCWARALGCLLKGAERYWNGMSDDVLGKSRSAVQNESLWTNSQIEAAGILGGYSMHTFDGCLTFIRDPERIPPTADCEMRSQVEQFWVRWEPAIDSTDFSLRLAGAHNRRLWALSRMTSVDGRRRIALWAVVVAPENIPVARAVELMSRAAEVSGSPLPPPALAKWARLRPPDPPPKVEIAEGKDIKPFPTDGSRVRVKIGRLNVTRDRTLEDDAILS